MIIVYIEDHSVNGTFVNDSLTRLSRGERIEIKSGDEIFTINPRSMISGEEVGAFMFINIRDRLADQRAVSVAPIDHTKDTPQASIMGLVSHHIEDFYVIGDQLGAGMCGQVHLCVHRQTRKQYAVKIIDTRKFPLSPGLSPRELRQEAELMKNLNHVILNYNNILI